MIPIIGGAPNDKRQHVLTIKRSDGLCMEVKVPRGVNVALVKRALADFSRGIGAIYLTDAETEFVADILGHFDAADEEKAKVDAGATVAPSTSEESPS